MQQYQNAPLTQIAQEKPKLQILDPNPYQEAKR